MLWQAPSTTSVLVDGARHISGAMIQVA